MFRVAYVLKKKAMEVTIYRPVNQREFDHQIPWYEDQFSKSPLDSNLCRAHAPHPMQIRVYSWSFLLPLFIAK